MGSSRCPRCYKKFKDQAATLNHLNQPYSSCRTHYEELIQVADALQSHVRDPDTIHANFETEEQPQCPSPMDVDLDDEEPEVTTGDLHINNCPTASHFRPTAASFHVDEYPNAAKVFDYGGTYMDKFDRDSYAQHRKDHLYYPFASRDEWEVASFLLRSQLSMGAIDRFLKLELVSLQRPF